MLGFRRVVVVVGALSCGVFAGGARGANPFWLGVIDTSWDNPLNWEFFAVPNDDDDVRLGNAPSVTLTGQVQFSSSGTINSLRVDKLINAIANFRQWVVTGTDSRTLTVLQDVTMLGGVPFSGGPVNTPIGLRLVNMDMVAPIVAINDFDVSPGGMEPDRFVMALDSGSTVVASNYFAVGRRADLVISSGRVSTPTFFSNRASSSTTVASGGTLELNGLAPYMELTAGSVEVQSGGNLLTADNTTFDIREDGLLTLRDSYVLPNNGELLITSRGDVVSDSYLDVGAGEVGKLRVDGAGSTLSVGGSIVTDWGLGTAGNADIDVTNEGVASLRSLRIGAADGRADVLVGGFGSKLTTSSTLEVGGGSTVRPVNVGVTGGGVLDVGDLATFNNQAVVTVTDSIAGSGKARFRGGATFNPGSSFLARRQFLNTTPSGEVEFTIDPSRSLVLNGGHGEIDLSNGYTVDSNKTVSVINNSDLTIWTSLTVNNASVFVDGVGSTLTVNGAIGVGFGGLIDVGPDAVLNATGGNTTFIGGGLLRVRNPGGLNLGTRKLTITDTARFETQGTAVFFNEASLDVTNSGIVNTGTTALRFTDGAQINVGGYADGSQQNTQLIVGGESSFGGDFTSSTSLLRVYESGTFGRTTEVEFNVLRIANGVGGRGELRIEGPTAQASFKVLDRLQTGGQSGSVATVNVNGGQFRVDGTTDLRTGTTFNMNAPTAVNLGDLVMRNNARLQFGTFAPGDTTERVIEARSLAMTETSVIDLSPLSRLTFANSLTPGVAPDGIIDLIARGFNGDTWTGTGGIRSSAAIANPEFGVAYAIDRISGLLQSVSVALDGDTDLDGDVDFGDAMKLRFRYTGAGGTGRYWADGDTDYDGDVDLADAVRLRFAYTGTGGITNPAPLSSDLTTAADVEAGTPIALVYDPTTRRVTLEGDTSTLVGVSVTHDAGGLLADALQVQGVVQFASTGSEWSALTFAGDATALRPSFTLEGDWLDLNLWLATEDGRVIQGQVVPEPTAALVGLTLVLTGRRRRASQP